MLYNKTHPASNNSNVYFVINLQSGRGSSTPVPISIAGPAQGWGWNHLKADSLGSLCVIYTGRKLHQLETRTAGAPLAFPALIRCYLPMCCLQNGRLRVPGLGAHKAQAQERKRTRRNLLPFMTSPWKAPIISSTTFCWSTQAYGWERRLPLLPGGLKPHFKKGTEDGIYIYIYMTIFWKYNQPQFAFTQWISQGSWLHATETNFSRLEEEKWVSLKDVESSETQKEKLEAWPGNESESREAGKQESRPQKNQADAPFSPPCSGYHVARLSTPHC